MKRLFQGHKDKSVVVLKHTFPDSDLVLSTPVEFSKNISGVYIEGDYFAQLAIYGHLKKLLKSNIGEACWGEWIGVFPPDEGSPMTVVSYEAARDTDKIQILNLVLPRQLAVVCNLRLSIIWELLVKFDGEIIQDEFVALPENFPNGQLDLLGGQEKQLLS